MKRIISEIPILFIIPLSPVGLTILSLVAAWVLFPKFTITVIVVGLLCQES